MIKSILLLVLVSSLTACLRTRSQIQGRNTVTPAGPPVVAGASNPVVNSNYSQQSANYDNQLSEMQSQMRELIGRVEVIEKNWNMSQNSEEVSELRKQMSSKMALYEEALVRLEKNSSSSSVKKTSINSGVVSLFDSAEAKFNAKDWRKAILAYQEYRDKNPKGKSYPEATYKIGVCFQELGLKKESKAFYKEVVTKFPKSRTSKKASYRLSTLK